VGGSSEFIPVAAVGAGVAVLDTGCDPRVCENWCDRAGHAKSLTICLRGASALDLCPSGFRSLVESLLMGIRLKGTSSAWLPLNVGRVLVASPYARSCSAHHVLDGMPARSSPLFVLVVSVSALTLALLLVASLI
jgi:hypothetical protein